VVASAAIVMIEVAALVTGTSVVVASAVPLRPIKGVASAAATASVVVMMADPATSR